MAVYNFGLNLPDYVNAAMSDNDVNNAMEAQRRDYTAWRLADIDNLEGAVRWSNAQPGVIPWDQYFANERAMVPGMARVNDPTINEWMRKRRENQPILQNAYNNVQSAGGFSGGAVNDRYGQSDALNTLQNFLPSIPGFNAPTQIGGQYPTYPASGAPSPGTPSAPSLWGGPFANRNPFGASS